MSVDTGPSLLPEGDTVDAGVTAQFIYDTRDAAFAPTRGLAASVEYMYSNDSLGADRNWQRLEAGTRIALPVRGDVIWLAAAGGSNLGSDLPVDRYFTLGGPGSFPGLELAQFRAPEYWTVSGSYLWKFADIQTLRGEAMYIGAQIEGGEIANWLENVSERGRPARPRHGRRRGARTDLRWLAVPDGPDTRRPDDARRRRDVREDLDPLVRCRPAGRPGHDHGARHFPLKAADGSVP